MISMIVELTGTKVVLVGEEQNEWGDEKIRLIVTSSNDTFHRDICTMEGIVLESWMHDSYGMQMTFSVAHYLI